MFLLMDGLGYGQVKGSMEAVEMKAKWGFRIVPKAPERVSP